MTIGVFGCPPTIVKFQPQLDFSKPRTRTANSDFWSRLTHQILRTLKSTIPNLQIYLPKMANSEKLGLGIDNPCMIVFLSLRMNKCLERVNDRHFGILESSATQWYQVVSPTQEFYFHRHIYSLWGRVGCDGLGVSVKTNAKIRSHYHHRWKEASNEKWKHHDHPSTRSRSLLIFVSVVQSSRVEQTTRSRLTNIPNLACLSRCGRTSSWPPSSEATLGGRRSWLGRQRPVHLWLTKYRAPGIP